MLWGCFLYVIQCLIIDKLGRSERSFKACFGVGQALSSETWETPGPQTGGTEDHGWDGNAGAPRPLHSRLSRVMKTSGLRCGRKAQTLVWGDARAHTGAPSPNSGTLAQDLRRARLSPIYRRSVGSLSPSRREVDEAGCPPRSRGTESKGRCLPPVGVGGPRVLISHSACRWGQKWPQPVLGKRPEPG
jgi:hypothetical protein